MKLEAYIITLARAVHRKPHVERLAASCPLPCTAVTAVDGSQLSADQIESVYQRYLHHPRYHLTLRLGEIGCFLSHRTLWQRIIHEGLDAALIMEDDIELAMPEFQASLAFALANVRRGDYLQFQVRPMSSRHSVLFTDGIHSILQPRVAPLRTSAQLVTCEAADRLLQVTRTFDRPVDTLLQMTWLTGIPVRVVTPSRVTEISQQIGGSTIGTGKPFLTRLRNEIHRPLYRAQIAMLSRRHA